MCLSHDQSSTGDRKSALSIKFSHLCSISGRGWKVDVEGGVIGRAIGIVRGLWNAGYGTQALLPIKISNWYVGSYWMDGLEERGGGGKTPCTPFLDNNVYNVIYTLVSGLESERRACLMSCFFFWPWGGCRTYIIPWLGISPLISSRLMCNRNFFRERKRKLARPKVQPRQLPPTQLQPEVKREYPVQPNPVHQTPLLDWKAYCCQTMDRTY